MEFCEVVRMGDIREIFENFLKTNTIFKDKRILQSNYTPENIPHREEQINQIAKILAPSLKLQKPSNLFIYGTTGTGKTLSVKHVLKKIKSLCEEKSISLQIFYINCKLKKVADTEYRLVAQLIKDLGKTVPTTGLPTDEIYRIFFNTINEKNCLFILVLDEIDQLVKKTGDEILYNLTRINSELTNSQISVIGISNDLTFTDYLDPRIKSSLSEEEINFPTYNAPQIQDILYSRSRQAFKDSVIEQGVIEKCAAYAAREHGDARRALELLRVAGEIAERSGSEKLKITHLDDAEEKIEKDRMVDAVLNQPKQFQAVLYSILSCSKDNQTFTGDIYNFYKNICTRSALRPLTQRRTSDIISELDMLGMINAKIISKGRYGRMRQISVALNPTTRSKIIEILEKDLNV